MIRSAGIIPLATLVAASLVASSLAQPAAAQDRGAGAGQWLRLAAHEDKAFRDYRWRFTSEDVIENGYRLRDLARSPELTQQHPSCGLAATTLSWMITGQYFSARRLAVSTDWHALSADYARQRRACLAELALDEREHPLPSWFGK